MRVKDLGTRQLLRPIGTEAPAKRQASSPELVERQQIPLWQERGWIRTGDTYTGNYQTQYGAFQGRIDAHEGWSNTYLRFFIDNPPQQVFRSPHRNCFQGAGGGRFIVHMSTMPKDASSGILTIERLLTEAIEKY